MEVNLLLVRINALSVFVLHSVPCCESTVREFVFCFHWVDNGLQFIILVVRFDTIRLLCVNFVRTAFDRKFKMRWTLNQCTPARLWISCLVTATDNSLARWSLCWGFTCHCVVGVKVDGYGSTHHRLPFKLGRIHGGKALELVNIAILI